MKLYHLQDSRSFRCVWLVEELGLPVEIVYAKRENNKAPAHFKSAHPMGKAPLLVLEDGKTDLIESAAINEYLLEHATPEQKKQFLGGGDPVAAAQVRAWFSYSEGTLLTHAIPITYCRWMMPEEGKSALPELEQRLGNNVRLDLQYIEDSLAKNPSGFLVGDTLTLADIQLGFSVMFVLVRGLGAKWAEADLPHSKKWIKMLLARDACKRAIEQGEDSMTLQRQLD